MPHVVGVAEGQPTNDSSDVCLLGAQAYVAPEGATLASHGTDAGRQLGRLRLQRLLLEGATLRTSGEEGMCAFVRAIRSLWAAHKVCTWALPPRPPVEPCPRRPGEVRDIVIHFPKKTRIKLVITMSVSDLKYVGSAWVTHIWLYCCFGGSVYALRLCDILIELASTISPSPSRSPHRLPHCGSSKRVRRVEQGKGEGWRRERQADRSLEVLGDAEQAIDKLAECVEVRAQLAHLPRRRML